MSNETAILHAGIPAQNSALYRRIRFSVGDPAALIELPGNGNGNEPTSTLIIRDIEMDRAARIARADNVVCPAQFAPEGGLSGDRETATAQATAEFLRRQGITSVRAERSMPLIFAHAIGAVGIDVLCDPELGKLDRRSKDEQEIQWLQEAQADTESAMRMACEMVGQADADAAGNLHLDGLALTSERVRAAIDIHLLERGYINPTSIVAGGPQGSDCHDHGHGPLRTGETVIIDIFPQNRDTKYNGDCTRTVVHGEIPDAIVRMHQAVVEAKAGAIKATRPGTTADAIHQATADVITAHGYNMGMPPDGAPDSFCSMVHGTGHGIGLDVHEPPLLDVGGPEIVKGDALTIEPGLYCVALGGIRVEDMVIVTDGGCRNLNTLPESLSWC